MVVLVYDVSDISDSVSVIVRAVIVAPVVAFIASISEIEFWVVAYDDILGLIYKIVTGEVVVFNFKTGEVTKFDAEHDTNRVICYKVFADSIVEAFVDLNSKFRFFLNVTSRNSFVLA